MRNRFLTMIAVLGAAAPAQAQEEASAVGTVIDVSGTELGTVTLTQSAGAVIVIGDLLGIAPGNHAVEFHQAGDCDSSTLFASAGDTIPNRGADAAAQAGPAIITADATGMVMLKVTTGVISLQQGDAGYVFDADGTALVIHGSDVAGGTASEPTDMRIACAVIEAAPAL